MSVGSPLLNENAAIVPWNSLMDDCLGVGGCSVVWLMMEDKLIFLQDRSQFSLLGQYGKTGNL